MRKGVAERWMYLNQERLLKYIPRFSLSEVEGLSPLIKLYKMVRAPEVRIYARAPMGSHGSSSMGFVSSTGSSSSGRCSRSTSTSYRYSLNHGVVIV